MRAVSDIWDLDGPVAFIQHGTKGNRSYEAVCPWCTKTLKDGLTQSIVIDLYETLLGLMVNHIHTCEYKHLTEMQVYVGKAPGTPRN